MKIYYDKRLKKFARHLRNDSTLGEVLLWQQLKRRKLMGYRFLRQKPIGWYIADFYCYKLKLVIEVDGYSHLLANNQKRDKIKDRYLQSIGLTVVRIQDNDVKFHMSSVIERLTKWIEKKG